MSDARERLKAVLTETGHEAKRSLGQNFLISDVVISRILDEAARMKPSSVIEIGPGPGALTDGLRAMGVPLRLIELDRTMAERWRRLGVDVIEGDALRIDWRPLVGGNAVLVSNLPYQISSSIVIDRSLDRPGLAGMVLMFQKEVAQRIRAAPSTEAYGMLSVIAQNFWDVATVADAGPRDFDPPPKVASRVLSFRRKDVDDSFDRARFLGFVKSAFAQRRKLLKSNLSGWIRDAGADEAMLLAKLASFGLKETARAEELSPSRFRELYEHLDRSRE